MAADFGKQPGYGRTRCGNKTDAWTEPQRTRLPYSTPRNVHLGGRFSRGRPSRRNFGILVGIGWPAADDGATILKETLWRYFAFQKKIAQSQTRRRAAKILTGYASRNVSGEPPQRS